MKVRLKVKSIIKLNKLNIIKNVTRSKLIIIIINHLIKIMEIIMYCIFTKQLKLQISNDYNLFSKISERLLYAASLHPSSICSE